jgi:hypothetical protein
MGNRVELRVREEGQDILIYNFKTATDAAEMVHFLSDMMPGASFLVQPIRH